MRLLHLCRPKITSNGFFRVCQRHKRAEWTKVGIWVVLKDFEIKKAFSEVVCFFCFNLTNRFHVAVRLFSNRSQKTSKCGKNISDTLLSPCVPLFCYHILTSSVIYY